MNFLTPSKTFLPHLIAVIILLKLSSIIMIPEASFAISVPYIPIAKPILAVLRAGASFDPSPVTATILLNYFNPVTIIYLCYGVDLANTLKFLSIN